MWTQARAPHHHATLPAWVPPAAGSPRGFGSFSAGQGLRRRSATKWEVLRTPHEQGHPPVRREARWEMQVKCYSVSYHARGGRVEEAGRLLASEDVASKARRPASLGPASLPPKQGAEGGSGNCAECGRKGSCEIQHYLRSRKDMSIGSSEPEI